MDHSHYFRGDEPCSCGKTMQQVQIEEPPPPPKPPKTVRPRPLGPELAAALEGAVIVANHEHVSRELNGPCVHCGKSFEELRAETATPELSDEDKAAELELERERQRERDARLELLEYIHGQADFEDIEFRNVSQSLRKLVHYGSTLDPKLRELLLSELQIAAQALRQAQSSDELAALARPVVVE